MNKKINLAVIENILSKFDLGCVEEIKPFATSGNIAYKIKVGSNFYFLRLCPSGFRWRSKEDITAEIELLNYLWKNDFPVFAPLVKRSGEKIISWENHFGYLREFSDAREMLNLAISEILEFGKILGKFHRLIENFQTKNLRANIFDLRATQENFKEDKKEILSSDFKSKEIFIEKFEKEIFSLNFPDSLPQGSIHEDLGKRHVLWDNNKRIAGIIDFDRFYYGKIVLDLGQACRGWCFINDWVGWSNENFLTLVKGYLQERKLADLEKQYLTDSIKFGILERALSFCLRYIWDTHNEKDREFAMQSVFGQISEIENNKEIIEEILNGK